MPKQRGTNPITGTIDGFTYYYNKQHGYLMRRKAGPSSKQVKKSPAFDMTRRNNDEFGRASHYGKVIRSGFHSLIRHCKDGTMYHRLSTRLREIMNQDTESVFGGRDLRRDTLAAFRHFEWDQQSLSKKYFELPVETEVYDERMEVNVVVQLNKKPKGAAAWMLYSTAVHVDFRTEKVKMDPQESDLYEYEKGAFIEGFTHYFPKQSLVFHGMCLVWYGYDATTADYYPLKEERVNVGFVRFVR